MLYEKYENLYAKFLFTKPKKGIEINACKRVDSNFVTVTKLNNYNVTDTIICISVFEIKNAIRKLQKSEV